MISRNISHYRLLANREDFESVAFSKEVNRWYHFAFKQASLRSAISPATGVFHRQAGSDLDFVFAEKRPTVFQPAGQTPDRCPRVQLDRGSIEDGDRPAMGMARTYARTGKLAKARQMADQFAARSR